MTETISVDAVRRAKKPGRLGRAFLGWLTHSTTVIKVEALSQHFRLITVAGQALQGIDWTPGQKIQIFTGGLAKPRTYTPIDWDKAAGVTRLLAWSHGQGPGSRWADTVAVGDSCPLVGPRQSLDLGGPWNGVVLFGDETSLGLGAAMTRATTHDESPKLLFEVTSMAECRPAAAALGLGHATLVERKADESHLADLETQLLSLVRAGMCFVLTGKAGSIQRLSRALKAAGVSTSQLRVKAYWAPGKTGLD